MLFIELKGLNTVFMLGFFSFKLSIVKPDLGLMIFREIAYQLDKICDAINILIIGYDDKINYFHI